MDDGGTAKAPVTRLRRRLSVEAEEVKSPSGVTTPTKKRGGRLAAKPQLDLIDENATEVSSKRVTRKTAAKAVVESAEEKEPLTPSRRSARIKSNSSIISETTNIDSPRAKRAARRLSQAGSDNETSTPVRQTRRTRKDSTSSIDKQVDSNTITKTPNISQTIVEETNNDDIETNSIIRKSPRLVGKKEKDDILDKSPIKISDSDRKDNVQVDEHNKSQKVDKETIQVIESSDTENPIITNNELNSTIQNKDQPTINDSSNNLLIALDENPQKIGSIKNKSCTALDSSNTFSSKRNRTKSWTSAAIDHSNYDFFYSDNEISKKKRKNNTKPLNEKGSGDNELFVRSEQNQSLDKGKENISTLGVKEKSFTANSIKDNKNGDLSKNINCNRSSLESPKKANTSRISEKDMLSMSTVAADPSPVAELFKNSPGIHVRSLIFVDEDSDSNTDIVSKNKKSEVQDQCVPIVHQIDGNDNLKSNISFEPMDIDETLPENVNNVHENNTASISQYNKRKSSISTDENTVTIGNVNKSMRKYSETCLESQNLEKSNNENKSTLILSQIKDTSANETNTSTKTSKLNSNDQLTKSVNASDVAKKKESNTTNLSQNYLTSTPLQQKVFPKLGIQLETSLMSPKNVTNEKIDSKNLSQDHNISASELDNNTEEQKSLTKKGKDDSEQSTSEEESETETSGRQNSMINDEVEEAGDDYESGDSQNEEDREYEKNNEILEKGETLDTEEDFSDDTDYEKDSFVVSSAEEDNELLSGSGDNLSMSDNELTMSSKSKKKYNERKDKEQKKASREMYNARHRLNESQSSDDDKPKTKKNKRQRLDSSALKSEDEITIKSQENNKTDQDNLVECDEDNISWKKKKKVKSLLESVDEPEIEKEIISNDCPVKKKKKVKSLSESVEEPENELINNDSSVKIKKKVKTLSETVEEPENEKELASNDSAVKKKKKVKSMSESECDEEQDNEKEMTIFDTSNIVEENPLLVHVKDEIKSPRKSFNISTIAINDAVEEVNINENMSVTDVNDSLDPLQATAGIDDEDESSEGENEEIMENYDSILKDLNKNTKKIKSSDISLNEHKQKKKTKERVVDELNLTLTKTKKNKQKSVENIKNEELLHSEFPKKTDQPLEQNEDDNDKASDSIDMRLLFPEDSNDSEHSCDNLKKNTKIDSPEPEYIPLKDNGDKTNLRASMDNESNDHLNFFIDTKGTRDEDTSQDTSIKRSAKKSKNKNNTSLLLNTETEELPVESMCTSEKKKKNKTSSQSGTNISEDITQDVEMNIKSSGKKNKKSKLSFGTSIDEAATQIDLTDLNDVSADTDNAVHSDKKKKKHSKKHMDLNDSGIPEIQTTDLIPGEASKELEPTSATKKKKKAKQSLNSSSVEIVDTDILGIDEAPVEVMYQSNKKKKHSIDKNQSNIEVDFTQLEDLNEEASDEVLYQSNKKKKHREGNLQSHIEVETVELEDTAPETASANSSSGKKKKKSKMLQDSFNESSTNTGKEDTEGTEIETRYEGHKKKKRTKQSVDITSDNAEFDNKYSGDTLSPSATTSSGSSKKKSKSNSCTVVKESQLETSPDDPVNEETCTSKKRKREILPEFIPIETNPMSDNTSILLQENERKKRKTFQNNEDKGITEKKYKKRKERDDEYTTEVPKVFKQSSSDKVYIQRLPSHILNQLEEKPRKDTTEKKKPKVISTTEFIVEDQRKAKRNKPSNYLEESVYLNDSPVLKKEKKSLKKPKVLPFIPTASTSDEGFTTNFRINILPGDNQFIAQSTNVTDFRTESIHASKLKKFRTFEKYKTQRRYKISKF